MIITWWPLASLVVIVEAVLAANRAPRFKQIFRYLPVPLWCYVLPMIAVSLGWLPKGHAAYSAITTYLFPFALALLLLGIDWPGVLGVGGRALLAAAVGAAGILVGVPLCVWVLRAQLSHYAWQGAGVLTATWTGGSMNLLAVRAILQTPESVIAPLIVVDTIVAYGWMALLVAVSASQRGINRWLGATDIKIAEPTNGIPLGLSQPQAVRRMLAPLVALLLSISARAAAERMPTSTLIGSSTGWGIILVTTGALILSLLPAVQQQATSADSLGYPCLYLVLAAVGAKASVDALWATPVWLLVGIGTLLFHGGFMLLAGRMLRIPLGLLATASQANLGGVVSAPLVGAVYHRSLAPVGLLLGLLGNALGSYLGLLSAALARSLFI